MHWISGVYVLCMNLLLQITVQAVDFPNGDTKPFKHDRDVDETH